MLTRRKLTLFFVAALAVLPLDCAPLVAQMAGMETHTHPKSEPSTTLLITGPEGKTLSLSPTDLKALPHKSVTVMNEHAKVNESYSGVVPTDLLAKVGVPVGKDLKGKAYVMYVVAEGSDHYKVLYSLDEVDAIAHAGDVLVADMLNGAPLTTDGAFKLVSSEDKRPARWVRNLTTVTVKVAE